MPRSEILDFRTALYKTKCHKCDSRLFWEAEFDADGTDYHTKCCGIDFALYPHTVLLSCSNDPDENPAD